uniref:Synapsin n=1 Tax=Plectus sambesii TaxID=2011161 RepID=A0A914UI22_9BILA
MIPIQLLGLRHDMTHLSSSSDQRQSVNAGTGPTSSSSHAISHPQSSSGSPSDRIRQSSSSSSGWLRSPTGVRTAMTTSTSQPFESLKDGISTGMNFLKRRFSTDQEEPAMDAPTTVQAGSTTAGPPPAGYAAQTTPGADQGFSLTGIASKVSATISAPTSPAKQQSGQSSMYSQVQGLTKNLFQAATGTGPTRPAYNKDKCKCVLVIDDQHADWSKYFRGKKILNEYDIRVEQAEFSEISLSSYSDSGCLVDMEINRGAGKVSRSFQPDFVIIRQPVRTATQDYSNIVIGLTFGGVSALNSLDSVYNFLNKPWVFGHLLRIQHKVGKDSFPLIDQAFYATLKEILF